MSHPAAGKQKFFQDPPKSQTKYCAATKVVSKVNGSRCGHTGTAEKERGWRMTPPTLEGWPIDPHKMHLLGYL